MRPALLSLLIICAASLCVAAPCTGAETQLAEISRQLTLDSLDRAKTALHSLSTSYPDCMAIVLQQARLAQAEGDVNAAADFFYRYTDSNPNDSTGLAYFGRFFLEQQDYMRADALSAVAVQKNPADPAALTLRGQVLVMKAQTLEAQAMLEKAVHLDPDDPEAEFQLGTIHDKTKSAPRAAECFRAVVKLNPHDARAWDYLALNLEPLGDLNGAETAYQKGLG